MILELLAGYGVLKFLEPNKGPSTPEQLKAKQDSEKAYIISHCEDSFSGCLCDLKDIYVKIKKND